MNLQTFYYLLSVLSEREVNGNFSQEKVEFVKNGIKTTVTVTFNEQGLPTETYTECNKVKDLEPSKEEKLKEYDKQMADLKKKLEIHKQKEEYSTCAVLKKEIEKLKALKEFIK